MTIPHSRIAAYLLPVLLLGAGGAAWGQAQRPPVAATVNSPEVRSDRRITFRIYAPQSDAVRLSGSDLPGLGPGAAMTRQESGVWETTVGPVPPGAYRYQFQVDGVPVLDPRNPATSESVSSSWSLVYVPGSDLSDTQQVPHGAVSEVTYYSTALNRFRRMHVYTPPGYEKGNGRYPVFYLLHGAGDSDDSWPTVGRAGFILDNLIAAGKAKPMLVVMPAGHTRGFTFGGPPPPAVSQPTRDEFVADFTTDVMPYVEKSYRVLKGRENRAIAGLSMGGGQTLNVALPNLEKFAYVGVFSSGLFNAFQLGRGAAGAAGAPATGSSTAWEAENKALLENDAKKGLRLLWFNTGKEDFLLQITRNTVDLFKRHGFRPEYIESEGGHTWTNWRDYLGQFAPRLFQASR
ncbi:MAG: alpha/beta hydrolase [Armatimonadota bacterium]